jgi:hypothetical protein
MNSIEAQVFSSVFGLPSMESHVGAQVGGSNRSTHSSEGCPSYTPTDHRYFLVKNSPRTVCFVLLSFKEIIIRADSGIVGRLLIKLDFPIFVRCTHGYKDRHMGTRIDIEFYLYNVGNAQASNKAANIQFCGNFYHRLESRKMCLSTRHRQGVEHLPACSLVHSTPCLCHVLKHTAQAGCRAL